MSRTSVQVDPSLDRARKQSLPTTTTTTTTTTTLSDDPETNTLLNLRASLEGMRQFSQGLVEDLERLRDNYLVYEEVNERWKTRLDGFVTASGEGEGDGEGDGSREGRATSS